MENSDLQNIWRSYDQKLERMLAINNDMAASLSRQKLDKQMSRLNRPKWTALIVAVPYTLLLISITSVALLAESYFVAIGFGSISLIMTTLILFYLYQLYLIGRVRNEEEVLSTQHLLSKLRLSSYKSIILAVFQLPFWSICWISINGLKVSPFVYGGINLLIFLILSYLAYWIYQNLSYKNKESKIREFFLSGSEWEPIFRSSELLEQIKEYEK